MNQYVAGTIAITVATLLSVSGMMLVRKLVGVEVLKKYHEVAGNLISVVGTLYAVLLGFVVVVAMQHTQDLRELVDQEASGLCNIYLCANGFPPEKKREIQTTCDRYANAVINVEWPLMRSGTYSPEAFREVWTLWKEITTYAPKTDTDRAMHTQITAEICNMTQNRRLRIIAAQHGTNPLIWSALIVGACFTVAFTYFFAVENLKAQVIMTTLVSLTLSLNIFLVFVFGSPFGGEYIVQPDSFKLDRMIFENFASGAPEPIE